MRFSDPPSLRLAPTQALMVRLCRRDPLHPVDDTVLGVLEEPGVPAEFLELAQRQGVQGLVLFKLHKLGKSQGPNAPFPKSVMIPLPLLQRQAVFWELEQDRVLSYLSERGLDVLLLKGGALRHTVYHSSVERPMADLDLLVLPEEVPGTMEALTGLGYGSKYPDGAPAGFREHHYHERVTHPNGFEVEVHWGLTRSSSPFRLSPDSFLQRGRILEFRPGLSVKVPSPEDMAIHLVSQAEHGRVRKFSRIVDLDRVVTFSEAFDWEYFRERGRDGRLSTVSAVTLRLANLLLGTPAPEYVLQGNEVPRVARWNIGLLQPTFRLMNSSERGRWANNSLFRMWCLPAWRLRWQALLELASGKRDPLSWVWDEKDGPEEEGPNLGRGMTSVLKILAYQVVVGACWISGTIFRVPRRPVRFWMTRGREADLPDTSGP